MNDFEKFIKDNRADLDVENPDVGLIWEGIRQSQDQGKRRQLWVAGIAASLILLIGFSVIFFQQSNSTLQPTPLASIAPELAQEEANYLQEVSDKMGTLDFENIDKEEYRDIFLELELLEEIHKEYKKDIPQFADQEQLVNTLLKYYERKLRILERLSREIQKKHHHEKVINKERSL